MRTAATRRRLCAALVLLPWSAVRAAGPRAPAPSVQGVVTKVIDGDSLWLQPASGAGIEVRLRDMDAPEICQEWGVEAKAALERVALGKPATLTASGRDSYGRTIGLLLVDGVNLSKWMVGEGHAWSHRTRYDRGPLVKEERMALALRRGLHATADPVLPKDFRKAHGPCRKS